MDQEWKYSLYSNKDLKVLHFNYDANSENLIICRQNEKRMFSMFKSHTHFFKHLLDLPPEERCFYEVILGKKMRKPYFDIDVSLKQYPDMTKEKCDSLIEMLVENIKETLYEYEPKILVFTSHRPDKLSYHIIVDRVCIIDCEESKAFAEKVLSTDMKEFVDSRVYNSVQQLRIVGSTKYGIDNKKKIDYELSDNFFIPKELVKDNFRKNLYILKASLVTYTTDCKLFRCENKRQRKKSEIPKGLASEFDIPQALKILSKRYKCFEYRQARELNGNLLVELATKEPYYCQIHKRVHENENAYITIQGQFRNIWFDCRRIEQHEKHLSPQAIGFIGRPEKSIPKFDGTFNLKQEN